MSKRHDRVSKNLEALRLPALQERYTKATGKASRSPNRTFLTRAILEAEKKGKPAPATPAKPPHQRTSAPTPRAQAPITPPVAQDLGAATGGLVRGRYSKMEISELQEKYLEVIGRATHSSDRGYLLWKLREADKGRIPIGPRKTVPLVDAKTIPLRLASSTISEMDEAWAALGFQSRTEFLREAIPFFASHCRTAGRPTRTAQAQGHV